MTDFEKVQKELVSMRGEMEASLADLVRIDSQQTEGLPGMPFGKGVHDAFVFIMEKARSEGFRCLDADGYGGHIELGNPDSETVIGILVHLDVVPEGEGWTHPPFGGEVDDGRMYGRGTSDDKGPVIAAYYALRAINQAGIDLPIRVRLILGLDEESEWQGMDVYLQEAGPVDFGFTADANFPVINREKGIITVDFAKKFSRSMSRGLELRKITGGKASNMVADKARALVYGTGPDDYDEIEKKLAAFRQEKGKAISGRGIGKSFEISAAGKSAHGATPEKGENAISILMDFLARLEFDNEDVTEFIDFYNDMLAYDLEGRKFKINNREDHSGSLTVNVGTIELSPKDVLVRSNIRYPVSQDPEEIYDRLNEGTAKYNLGLIKVEHQPALDIPADSRLVETLMQVYRRRTGDLGAEALATGGGTYARAMDNVVAFGMLFPDEEEVFHQADESISLDNLMAGAEIYADAILSLCEIGDRDRME